MNVEFAAVILILTSVGFMIPSLKKKVLIVVEFIKGNASCVVNLNIFSVEVIIVFNIPGIFLGETYKFHVLV